MLILKSQQTKLYLLTPQSLYPSIPVSPSVCFLLQKYNILEDIGNRKKDIGNENEIGVDETYKVSQGLCIADLVGLAGKRERERE